MDPVLAHHIVLGARIWEIVHLNIVLHAFTYETQTVLPHDHRVNRALTDEKLALEILCLADEACLRITFRIPLRMVHISLSIHHLVPFPVNHRTACDSNLEDFRVVCDE